MNRSLIPALIVLAMTTTAFAQSPGAAPQYAITGLEAKLFYANSGRFSANVLGDPKFVFWNTVIGAGSADGPSDNTLLVVTVGGPAKGYGDDLALHVRATADTMTLVDRVTPVGEFNTNGNWYGAYWLYDTGCVPVKIEAWLTLGDETGPVIAKAIPFRCGE